MADITWKRTGSLLRKLFQILIDAPEGLQAAEALAKVAEGETLSEYEAGTYSTGDRCFEKIHTLGNRGFGQGGLANTKALGLSPMQAEQLIRRIPILKRLP